MPTYQRGRAPTWRDSPTPAAERRLLTSAWISPRLEFSRRSCKLQSFDYRHSTSHPLLPKGGPASPQHHHHCSAWLPIQARRGCGTPSSLLLASLLPIQSLGEPLPGKFNLPKTLWNFKKLPRTEWTAAKPGTKTQLSNRAKLKARAGQREILPQCRCCYHNLSPCNPKSRLNAMMRRGLLSECLLSGRLSQVELIHAACKRMNDGWTVDDATERLVMNVVHVDDMHPLYIRYTSGSGLLWELVVMNCTKYCI